jgi:uncharacterized C2H2 Zn-finger protein
MEQNDAVKKHKCVFCDFASKRKYDLQRHQNAKHIQKDTFVADTADNIVREENVPTQLMCKMCNKIYKTKKCLASHEVKCDGIDILTCPRCMISFATRHSKSRHIAANKCKAQSIIYARIPNAINITNISSTLNIPSIQNISINNYGSERTDYLDYDKMLEIFKNIYNIPSLLTKHIHFNKEFPENNNILQVKNDKTSSLVKIDGEFIFRNINSLIQELIKDKTIMMYDFAQNNKERICVKMDTAIYGGILDLLKAILFQARSDHYKIQEGIIRDMIKNSKNTV